MKDARQVRTRLSLHRAVVQLIAGKPLDAITVREITREAGIAYATFFRHYPTKEALLEDAAGCELRRLVDLVLPIMGQGDGARASCEALCRTIKENWDLWRALLTGRTRDTIRQELLRKSLEVAEGREEGWPPHDVVTAIVVAAMIEILSWWLAQQQPVEAERVAHLLYDRAIAPALQSA